MEKILDVKNLRISFRTGNGTVKAVRNISFHLEKGETLAIVGESGSGKSVTSRAIMGILAGNSIVEGGEIIYDGQDLLKIPEEDFHYLRGEKISMIFQDPLSSLNPIVKIGRQLTEAMLIKGKSRQKKSRKDFNKKLALLLHFMNKATGGDSNPGIKQQNKLRAKTFDSLAYKYIMLENDYNLAYEMALECVEYIDDLLFEIEKNAVKGFSRDISDINKSALKSCHKFVVNEDKEKLNGLREKLSEKAKTARSLKKYDELPPILNDIKDILKKALDFVKPDFFAMAYHLMFSAEPLPSLGVQELNAFLSKNLNSEFMNDFLDSAEKALTSAFEQSIAVKKSVIDELVNAKNFFSADTVVRQETKVYSKALVYAVENSINKLVVLKDNLAYTFRTSINDAVKRYFSCNSNNQKEQARYDKQIAAYNKKIEAGKKLNWEVVPANIVDVDIIKAEILQILDKMTENYREQVSGAGNFNAKDETQKLFNYFKETAAAVVYHITPAMAKARALKIMDEVGIPEPRKRYNQYPFQFSGGMRQRIVIAIALSVLPDILICDEPTTALDVTIQSQILELINKLKEKHKLSIIFITHDLGVVANMADRIAVMYAGKIVEYGTSEDVFYSPAHPYTWALLSSMPDLDTKEKLEAIPGTPPNMIYPPVGDAFAARNKYAMKIDFEKEPPLFKISDTHYAATWLLHPDAPKVEMPKIVAERIMRKKNLQKASENAEAVADVSAGKNVETSEKTDVVDTGNEKTTEEKSGIKPASKRKVNKTADKSAVNKEAADEQ